MAQEVKVMKIIINVGMYSRIGKLFLFGEASVQLSEDPIDEENYKILKETDDFIIIASYIPKSMDRLAEDRRTYESISSM